MLEVTAYKCDYCNTLHSNYFDCINCEISCKNKLKQEQILFRYNRRRDYIANYPRLNATTIEELEILIVEAYYKLFKFKITNLKINIKGKEICSNSYAKPIGGITNWCNLDKSLPKGYLGYSGSITFDCVWDSINRCYPKINKIYGICTGGGASGNYTLTLFKSDFPLLKIDL
jgi:hypothetical protein